MNSCNFIGRLTRDPETKSYGTDGVIANFTIAVRRVGKQKEGEPDADFFRMTAFGKTAELVKTYFTKGKEIGVSARCRNRSYEKDGVTQNVTEFTVSDITFIGSRDEQNATTATRTQTAQSRTQSPVKARQAPVVDIEDEDNTPF